MVAEELLFWLAPIDAAADRAGVLCRRHADAMVVPRGWTLDDQRNGGPRLFQAERVVTTPPAQPASPPATPRSRPRGPARRAGEQLQIDGTGEIARPAVVPPDADEPAAPAPSESSAAAAPQPVADPAEPSDEQHAVPEPDPAAPWMPRFDTDDDLNGVLDVRSPLLSRAFRGTERR